MTGVLLCIQRNGMQKSIVRNVIQTCLSFSKFRKAEKFPGKSKWCLQSVSLDPSQMNECITKTFSIWSSIVLVHVSNFSTIYILECALCFKAKKSIIIIIQTKTHVSQPCTSRPLNYTPWSLCNISNILALFTEALYRARV